MPIDQLLREKREEILCIAARRGAYNVRVFGSVAGGKVGPESSLPLCGGRETGPGAPARGARGGRARMKLPRDMGGEELAVLLRRRGGGHVECHPERRGVALGDGARSTDKVAA
jgi:hypothetical protein